MNGFNKRNRFNKNTCWSLFLIALGSGIILSFFLPSWFLAILGGVILFLIGVLLLLC